MCPKITEYGDGRSRIDDANRIGHLSLAFSMIDNAKLKQVIVV